MALGVPKLTSDGGSQLVQGADDWLPSLLFLADQTQVMERRVNREYRSVMGITESCAQVVTSITAAYMTYRFATRQDQMNRQAERKENYAILTANQPKAADALDFQFAIGFLEIKSAGTAPSKKAFIGAGTRMTAGRSGDNKIVLRASVVSRCHFLITADNRYAYVEDLKSANGTRVNKSLIHGRVRLYPGDLISIGGSCRIEFWPLISAHSGRKA